MVKTQSWFQKTSKTPVSKFQSTPGSLTISCKIKVLEWGLGFKGIVLEYCKNSSLHGLQYLGRSGHYRRERWFWFLSLLVSMGAAFYLIAYMYLDYIDRPVETIFGSAELRLHDIPFPAVTFCDYESSISKSRFLHYMGVVFDKDPGGVLNATQVEALARLSDMVKICSNNSHTKEFLSFLPKLEEYFQKYEPHIKPLSSEDKTLAYGSQPCNNYIAKCYWKRLNNTECLQHVSEIMTVYGYCCVFNALPPNQTNQSREKLWNALDLPITSFEELLPSKDGKSHWPLKQTARGFLDGLAVFLNHSKNYSICPSTKPEGSLVFVTSQLDLPPLRTDAVGFVAPQASAKIKIQPDITLSDRSIRFLSTKSRACYYANEYKLRWHNYYTISNCIEECRVLDAVLNCNCTMPAGVSFRDLCKSKTECMKERDKIWTEADNPLTTCSWCMPTCTEIEYNADISNDDKSNQEGSELTRVFVHMGVNSVQPKLRKQSITLIQLLSNAGGLLGLFLGFSVFSLLELLYYSTLCIKRIRARNTTII